MFFKPYDGFLFSAMVILNSDYYRRRQCSILIFKFLVYLKKHKEKISFCHENFCNVFFSVNCTSNVVGKEGGG